MGEFFSAILKPLIPGAIGAALAACLGKRGGKLHMVLSFFVGFAFATFAADPVMHFFRMDPAIYSSGVGFLLGFSGMTICSRTLIIMNETDIKGIIESKLK